MRTLVALPVFNEVKHVDGVLNEVKRFASDILVVDDGSTDGTRELLAKRNDVRVELHRHNRGYGAALHTAFRYAAEHGFDGLITIDCDLQHEPSRIPDFEAALPGWDIISGSRYLRTFDDNSAPPEDRWKINRIVTSEINAMLGLRLTDAFCGFKAYRVGALAGLDLTDTGYAMPLEFWVQAAINGLRIRELAVPLIYLDENRSFGGNLDHAETRLAHYRQVLRHSLLRTKERADLRSICFV
ncbi:MAG: glycosyltransferase family 2 protein [Planctomycetales bacterium]|nr:glycosyltransferase family 2 protein [Planctomycetales bacterium]